MSRLPIPGSDDGTWGGILNDFLNQEHNADGSQKTLPLTKGGTGATTASTARTNLAAVGKGDLVFNVKDYGAKGDGVTDDTTAIQAAIAAAGVAGYVYLPAGTYLLSASLQFLNEQTIRGAGRYATILIQVASTADVFIKPTATTGYKSVTLGDFSCDATANTGANIGGILMQGVTMSLIDNVRFNQVQIYCIKVLGGTGGAASGDAMYNTIRHCLLGNYPGNGVQITPAAAGGSHPDSTRILDCHFNSATGIGVKIDGASADSAGFFASDSCVVAFCSIQSLPIALQLAGSFHKIIGNRLERTSSTMTVQIDNPNPTNNPALSNVFAFNSYATHGSYASLIFTDNGVHTQQIAEPGYEVVTTQGALAFRGVNSAQSNPTYGSNVVIDPAAGDYFSINVTDGNAFTVANPSMDVPGKRLTILIRNTSGGALGTITWGSAYRLAGAFTNPANGLRRLITFRYDTLGLWLEESRSATDL
jgi:hypothetical protein